MRFLYDTSSDSRKKKNCVLSFPQILDMSAYVTTDDGAGAYSDKYTYTLQAVLCHKGSSAYRGHYEVQVLDTM